MASMLGFLVLCVVFAAIDARIIRTDKVEVPDNGLTLKIAIKPDRDGKMKVQVKSIDKVRRRFEDVPFKSHGFVFNKAADDKDVKLPGTRNKDGRTVHLPTIGNRFGIKGGVCPEGYVSRGGYCFPDYE